MKFLKIGLVCLFIGVVFVIFPRGKQYTTIYNDGESVNEFLPWYSIGFDINVNGIPFKTTIDSVIPQLEDQPDVIESNELKILGNFLIGAAVGFGITQLISRRKKKN